MLSLLPFPVRNALFHTWFLLTRPMTLGARVMLINDKGEVCLIKHGYVAGWQLPGGGVDTGETIGAAAIRELAEEAGMQPTAPLQLFAVYKNIKTSKRDHVALYVCRNADPISGFKINGIEIIGCDFFAPDHLPEDVTGSARRRIEEVIGGKTPDPFW
jgi:ADP-ribose pyrophosphatase YjhB (NUDIX family)